MDLEIILRNGGYVRARGSAEADKVSRWGRSSKWREMLAFPNVRDCKRIRDFLEENGSLTFKAITGEPIGEQRMSVCIL